MPDQITPVPLKAGDLMATRLTGMKMANLSADHKAWLDKMMASAKERTDVEIDIIGFASTAGASNFNSDLSRERAWAVRDYINSRSGFLASRIKRFVGAGEDANKEFGRDPTKEKDGMDYHWRAVEVHVRAGGLKPAPKPDVDPVPPPKHLPGATDRWAVGSGGSMSFTIPETHVATIGINIFLFEKLDDDRRKGVYLSVPVGVNLSLENIIKFFKNTLPKSKDDSGNVDGIGKLFLEAIRNALLTGAIKGSLFPGKMKPVKVQNAFRHKDLQSAGVAQGEILGGAKKGISVSGKLPTFGPNGKIVHFTTKTFFEEVTDDIPFVGQLSKPFSVPGKPGELPKIEINTSLAKGSAGGLLFLGFVS